MARIDAKYKAEWDPQDGTPVAKFVIAQPDLADRLKVEQILTQPRTGEISETDAREYVELAAKLVTAWSGVTVGDDDTPATCDTETKLQFFGAYFNAALAVLFAVLTRGRELKKKDVSASTAGPDSSSPTSASPAAPTTTERATIGVAIG